MKADKLMSHTSLNYHQRFSSKLKCNSVLTWPKPENQTRLQEEEKKAFQIFSSVANGTQLVLWRMDRREGQEDTDYINKAEVGQHEPQRKSEAVIYLF